MLQSWLRPLSIALSAVIMLAVTISQLGTGIDPTSVSAQAVGPFKVNVPFADKNGPYVTPNVLGLYYGGENVGTIPQRAKESGASWARAFINWDLVEPTQGVPYNFAATDAKLNTLVSQGLTPILNIADAPAFAASPKCGPFKPDGQAAFVKFATAVVDRYSKGPWNVKYYALYNEPDTFASAPDASQGGCWGENPAAYANMLKAAYPAMKGVDGSIKVVFGPMALDLFTNGNQQIHARLFLDDVLKAGAGDSFDVIAFNYYIFARTNWDQFGTGLLGKAQYVRNVLAAAGKTKPIWIAETGLLSGPTAISPTRGRSDDAVANFVTQSMAWSMVDAARPNKDGVFSTIWFTMVDTEDFASWGQGNDWGLIKKDGTIKDPYRAFQTFAREMSGARYVRNDSEPTFGSSPATPCAPGGGVGQGQGFFCDALQKYVFNTNAEANEKWVVWIDSGNVNNETSATRQITVPGSVISIKDKYGAEQPINRQGGNAVVTISQSPLYLTFTR